MGISGLIPFLEKASSEVHLKNLRGSTVAVDTYCWLHKGVFSCADKLVRGEDTDQYIQYCLKYVQMLLSYDIKPILVFDGQHLPAKALTERRRREQRQQSKIRAAELLRLGNIEEARSHMRRCVDVTHEMALKLIRECRDRNIDCIVAPYEADAQMAWLNKVDLAQYVVTEDSDLTLFGARKVIFKLDLTGAGLLVEAEKLYLAMGCRQEKYNFDKFRRMCILSGCDYLDSLPGIGLAKACKFMLKTEQEDMWIALKKIPQYLNMRNLEVNDDYIDGFLKAEATFKHMYIFNPLERRMERLHELAEFNTDERYCSNAGILLDDSDTAMQLALGNLNPFTFKQLDNWHPDLPHEEDKTKNVKRAKHKSVWKNNFEPHAKEAKVKPYNSCALYFKKIDFISKTIDAEIEATITADNAKPEEAEVFCMYKSEIKRKRECSRSSSESNASPPDSPVPTKSRHNPFAKEKTTEQTQLPPSPICENSSLLRILSPKKYNEETNRKQMRLNAIKRSIFSTDQVEIKSRFFAANVKQVNQRQFSNAAESSSIDLSEEIAQVEKRSKSLQQEQAQLYNSPSPQKKVFEKINAISPSHHADSGIESITSDDATITESVVLNQGAESIDGSHIDAIVLSDTDESTETASTLRTKRSNSVVERRSVLRLGLTKPKIPAKTDKKTTKSTKFAETKNSDQSQTRLSMFGFQKRPNLK